MPFTLTETETSMLDGEAGEAVRICMALLCSYAKASNAEAFIPVTRCHISTAWYSGKSQLDFVERLHSEGAKVAVPTMLAASITCLSRPEFDSDPDTSKRSTKLAELLVGMGCRPSFSCTPYYDGLRPTFGECVSISESSAVPYLNSIYGARTNQGYGFADLAIAVCGRAPLAGLYIPENRKATLVVDLSEVPYDVMLHDAFYDILGQYIGRECDGSIPVIVGLPNSVVERHLRAVCASAATAGSIRMFHVPGVTPEAPNMETAIQHAELPRKFVSLRDLKPHRDSLSTRDTYRRLNAVCLGAPQFSLEEFDLILAYLGNRSVHPDIRCSASASRLTYDTLVQTGKLGALEAKGVIIIPDTCTYASLVDVGQRGLVMTNSAKWAYYGPMCFQCEVALGSLEECVLSAIDGKVTRDDGFWSDDLWR